MRDLSSPLLLSLLFLVLGAAACHSSQEAPPRSSAEGAAPPPALDAATSTGPVSQIDAMLRADWVKEGVVPAPRADDARFLRRVYIDTVGTIPPPEVVTSFALDASPDKRARMVETLLASPAYAEHWGTYWADTLLGQTPVQEVDKGAFQKWMRGRYAANAPWNQIVTELLTAQGQNGEGGPRYPGGPGATSASPSASPTPGGHPPAAPMVPAAADEPASGAPAGPINPPVNWFIKYKEAPQDLAGNASRIFLGVQIQCAQCHDHKTEKWKQEDFRSFASCFMRTRVEAIDKGPAMGAIKRANVVDIGRPLFRYAKNPELTPFASAVPKALDGSDLSRSPDARQALAAWITAPQNPWFAQAMVNRMWGHYLGRGFVDPIDDIRPSNPVTAPEVLAKLSEDFKEHGYDLKRLVRVITSTEAYQLSSAAPATGATTPTTTSPSSSGADAPSRGAAPNKLWSRFRLEPLGPEELLNALMDATGVEDVLRHTKANVDRIRSILFVAYSYLFDVDEEFDQTDFEGTVSQALSLLNGRLVGGGTSDLPGSALEQILKAPGLDPDKITALYLRTLSRPPTAEELEHFTRYVGEPRVDPPASASPSGSAPSQASQAGGRPWGRKLAGKGPNKMRKGQNGGEPEPLERLEEKDAANQNPKRRAYEDVFWALLNSSEFTFNH
jgi:hypothetical protein